MNLRPLDDEERTIFFPNPVKLIVETLKTTKFFMQALQQRLNNLQDGDINMVPTMWT